MTGPYDDIIDMSRPDPTGRARMSRRDRAAQFAPFAALTGYHEMISESERQTQERPVMTEELAAELSAALRELERGRCGRVATIQVFVPDPVRPTGGSIATAIGRVRRVDDVQRLLELTDGRSIPLDDIFGIEILCE